MPYLASELADLSEGTDPEEAMKTAFVTRYDRIMDTAEGALAEGHPALTHARAVGGQLSPEPDKHMVDVLTQDQNVHNRQEHTRITATHPGKENDGIDMA
ncbi:hypothetical protein MY11210_006783 [Beauveria gryllotalpidicola]